MKPLNRASASVTLAIVFILAATLACGSSNAGTQIGTSAPAAATQAPQLQIYHVGDVVQVQDHTIVLNSASLNNGNLQANFTVENKGAKELAVSSLMSFEAKSSDGTKLEQAIFDCPSGGLDGTVLPGDKLKGNICWTGATGGAARIYYTASLFGSGAVVWEVSQ